MAHGGIDSRHLICGSVASPVHPSINNLSQIDNPS